MKKPTPPEWPHKVAHNPAEGSPSDSPVDVHEEPDSEADYRRSKHAVRDRVRRVLVGVTPDERVEIKRKAKMAGMSVAGYLRAAALNRQIRSVYDYAAVQDLCKVSGDLGRFGGLLKLWLAERKGEGAPAAEVDQLLRDTRALMEELRQRIVLP